MCLATKCLIFDITPIVLHLFEDIKFIWCFHDSLFSIRTPKYFTYSMLSREVSLLEISLLVCIYVTDKSENSSWVPRSHVSVYVELAWDACGHLMV